MKSLFKLTTEKYTILADEKSIDSVFRFAQQEHCMYSKVHVKDCKGTYMVTFRSKKEPIDIAVAVRTLFDEMYRVSIGSRGLIFVTEKAGG